MMKKQNDLTDFNETDKLFQELDLIILYNAGMALLNLGVSYLNLGSELESNIEHGVALPFKAKTLDGQSKEELQASWSVRFSEYVKSIGQSFPNSLIFVPLVSAFTIPVIVRGAIGYSIGVISIEIQRQADERIIHPEKYQVDPEGKVYLDLDFDLEAILLAPVRNIVIPIYALDSALKNPNLDPKQKHEIRLLFLEHLTVIASKFLLGEVQIASKPFLSEVKNWLETIIPILEQTSGLEENFISLATSRITAEMNVGIIASQSSKLMVDKLISLNYLTQEQVEKIDKVLLNGETIPGLLDCIYRETGYDLKEILKDVYLEKNKGPIQNLISICQKLSLPLPNGGIFKNIQRRADELESYFNKNPKPEKNNLPNDEENQHSSIENSKFKSTNNQNFENDLKQSDNDSRNLKQETDIFLVCKKWLRKWIQDASLGILVFKEADESEDSQLARKTDKGDTKDIQPKLKDKSFYLILSDETLFYLKTVLPYRELSFKSIIQSYYEARRFERRVKLVKAAALSVFDLNSINDTATALIYEVWLTLHLYSIEQFASQFSSLHPYLKWLLYPPIIIERLKANYVRYLDSFYGIIIKEHSLLNVVQALYEKEKSDLIKHLYFWEKINLSNTFLLKTKENRKKKFNSPNERKLLKEFISENNSKFHLVFFGSMLFILVTTLNGNLLVNPITGSSEIITIVKEEVSVLNYALPGIIKITIKNSLSKKSKFLSDLVDLINNNQEIIHFDPVIKQTNQNLEIDPAEIDSVSQKIIQQIRERIKK